MDAKAGNDAHAGDGGEGPIDSSTSIATANEGAAAMSAKGAFVMVTGPTSGGREHFLWSDEGSTWHEGMVSNNPANADIPAPLIHDIAVGYFDTPCPR